MKTIFLMLLMVAASHAWADSSKRGGSCQKEGAEIMTKIDGLLRCHSGVWWSSQDTIDALSATSVGQPCWEFKGQPANADGLVCRNGVFQLASSRSRWEEYRNLSAKEADKAVMEATKEGAACHKVRAAKIIVCYWQ